MRITYYALKQLDMGDGLREPGDLVPEAASWPFVSGSVAEGRIAPVLVVTLPEDVQMMLLEWEEAQASKNVPEAAPAEEPSEDDDTATEQPAPRGKANAKEKAA